MEVDNDKFVKIKKAVLKEISKPKKKKTESQLFVVKKCNKSSKDCKCK